MNLAVYDLNGKQVGSYEIDPAELAVDWTKPAPAVVRTVRLGRAWTTFRGKRLKVAGQGNGPIDAFVHAVRSGLGATLDVVDYAEHAVDDCHGGAVHSAEHEAA